MDLFMGGQSHAAGLDLSALLEMATPRSYYLWSWMPPELSTRQAVGGRWGDELRVPLAWPVEYRSHFGPRPKA